MNYTYDFVMAILNRAFSNMSFPEQMQFDMTDFMIAKLVIIGIAAFIYGLLQAHSAASGGSSSSGSGEVPGDSERRGPSDSGE